ncbi:M20 family metallopeptidase [Fictibacillus sp. WQ 8-8]|uniref:M20 family metallopeptidase n=1 Tax=Fictibacillus sp. WQ 8-8 TaxID=2938788 RepID=UPI00210AB138|nr:M20 family metallopeptidase [Fictibacillus sp. WQ 8-8]MCQ6268366.1 M20 family metallopeptidase [Fictibacillus sp. WQ 8-8]
MNETLKFLKEKESEMLSTLRTLVEKESPSLNKELTDEVGELVLDTFCGLTGGSATVIPNQEYGNHIRGEWGEGDEQILILTHFDTVWPEGEIERLPFKIEDGKVYGPGVFDMKGGLVQGIYALHALKELQRKVSCKVVVLFTSDEEIGSPTSQQLIEEEARKSKFVLVLEPALSPKGALKTSRKGVAMLNVEVNGLPAHSGVEPENGISAIEELAHQTIYLHSLNNYELGTTVNVGVIKGGTHSNVVAARAEAEIDVRFNSQKEFDRVIPFLKNLTPHIQGTEISVTGGINRPPLERTEQVGKMYELAKNIARDELHFDLLEKATGGGSDGSFTALIAPTLDGLGAVGDGAHAEHEHLILSEMPVRSALLALLIEKLSSVSFAYHKTKVTHY